MSSTLKRLATEDGSVSPPPLKKKAQASSATTSSAVSNFFKPASQQDPEKVSWKVVGNSLLVCKYDKPDSAPDSRPRRIAAFDFDSTLISTSSGKRFARDGNDWKWWHGQVPLKLRELADEGYFLAVLSNQGGISLDSASKTIKSDKRRLADFKLKVKSVLTQLDLPIALYAATGKDMFRKPRPGMWDKLLQDQGLVGPDDVDLESSYFIGDAGGRTGSSTGGTKPDFSCSDRDMASNVGIKFMTPEEFFLGEPPRPFAHSFDPSTYLSPLSTSKTESSPEVFTKKNDLELVIFCGSPGAGKSTWFQTRLEPLGYHRVNQDLLKTIHKCLKTARELLDEGKCVAVDNTNADINTREQWIKLASTFKIPIRCVHFTAPAKICEHNDAVRALARSSLNMNPEKRAMLPKLAFTGFTSRYHQPSLSEGFEDITRVDFQFTGTEEQKAAWSKFWV